MPKDLIPQTNIVLAVVGLANVDINICIIIIIGNPVCYPCYSGVCTATSDKGSWTMHGKAIMLHSSHTARQVPVKATP